MNKSELDKLIIEQRELSSIKHICSVKGHINLEITEEDMLDVSHLTSGGNQLKYKLNNFWIKCDYRGYEGLAEYYASILLRNSNLEDYATYLPCSVQDIVNDRKIGACISLDFKPEGYSFYSLQKSLRFTNTKLIGNNPKERLNNILGYVKKVTGNTSFVTRFLQIYAFDTLILNEDRHLRNLGFLVDKEGKIKILPIFDNGLSLLSDLYVFNTNSDLDTSTSKTTCKLITKSFDELAELIVERPEFQKLYISYNSMLFEIGTPIINYPLSYQIRASAVLRKQMEKYEGILWSRL